MDAETDPGAVDDEILPRRPVLRRRALVESPETTRCVATKRSRMPTRDSPTKSAIRSKRWNAGTQTPLSIPVFFDLAAVFSAEEERENAENASNPPLLSTPERVVKAVRVLPNPDSPRLRPRPPRSKLLTDFRPMQTISEMPADVNSLNNNSNKGRYPLSDSSMLNPLDLLLLDPQQQKTSNNLLLNNYADYANANAPTMVVDVVCDDVSMTSVGSVSPERN